MHRIKRLYPFPLATTTYLMFLLAICLRERDVALYYEIKKKRPFFQTLKSPQEERKRRLSSHKPSHHSWLTPQILRGAFEKKCQGSPFNSILGQSSRYLEIFYIDPRIGLLEVIFPEIYILWVTEGSKARIARSSPKNILENIHENLSARDFSSGFPYSPYILYRYKKSRDTPVGARREK